MQNQVGLIRRQRWSGLWFGAAIGWGAAWMLWGIPLGLFPLSLGLAMETIARRRMDPDIRKQIKQHRWAGFWNGVVIGMGLGWIFGGDSSMAFVMGCFPVVLGICMEIIQQRHLNEE